VCLAKERAIPAMRNHPSLQLSPFQQTKAPENSHIKGVQSQEIQDQAAARQWQRQILYLLPFDPEKSPLCPKSPPSHPEKSPDPPVSSHAKDVKLLILKRKFDPKGIKGFEEIEFLKNPEGELQSSNKEKAAALTVKALRTKIFLTQCWLSVRFS